MTVWLLGLAVASGLTHRTTRAPLPARWVERPLTLPAGWKVVDLSFVDGRPELGGRLSLGPTFELRAASGSTGPQVPLSIGAGLALGRGEAPSRSAALQFTWDVPAMAPVTSTHRLQLALPVRRQWGGSRWTLAPLAEVRWPERQARVGLHGEVGLQAGPLGVVSQLDLWTAGPLDRTTGTYGLGGFLQLNRAIRCHGIARRGDAPRHELGLELSL